jgi:RNA polymerase sigma-70 factor, ECF subfamily
VTTLSLPQTGRATNSADAYADSQARELLTRAQAGEPAAVRALYGAHARYIAGVVHRMLGSDADVDDVVQDTFLDGLDALSQLKEPRALRGWLATIAVRRVHRLLTRRRRRRVLLGFFAHFVAQRSDPAAAAPAFDLYEALDSLPVELRVPWMLARVEGWLLPEVAHSCGVSLATIKRRLRDAEQQLQGALRDPHAMTFTAATSVRSGATQ